MPRPTGASRTLHPRAPGRRRRDTLLVVLMLLAALCLEMRPIQTAGTALAAGPPAPGGIATPRLFFSDLESGPNTGGQDNLGAFITIYGEGFGATRGTSTVTIGGKEVARYVLWGQDNAVARKLDRIVVQPGPGTTSGNMVVTVNGKASNPLPFTVRPGDIYFVSTSGKDSNGGSFEQPWRTIVKARSTIAAGDIAYVRDGVSQTAEDNFDASLSIGIGGLPGRPKAIVAYPGATATIGSTTGPEFGLRIPNIEVVADYWVFAGLVFRGANEAMELGGSSGSKGWRIVGNDFSNPRASGCCGAFVAALATDVKFLGNAVHDVGVPGKTKLNHAVYFTTDSSRIEVGWNHIRDVNTCRAVQFHSSPLNGNTGRNQYDLSVHDNLIHGAVCDGINFATVDPSKGPVWAFNNVIYDVGRGPAPPDGDANYACIHLAAGTNTGADGTGTVEIFNNTLYNCGARKRLANPTGDEGAFSRGPGSPRLLMDLRNNIVYAVGGGNYIAPNSATGLIKGSHNLWFGGGGAPAFLAGNISADPMFVDAAARDFRAKAGSPAIDAGTDTRVGFDYAGASRPQGRAYDIGAYEFTIPGRPTGMIIRLHGVLLDASSAGGLLLPFDTPPRPFYTGRGKGNRPRGLILPARTARRKPAWNAVPRQVTGRSAW